MNPPTRGRSLLSCSLALGLGVLGCLGLAALALVVVAAAVPAGFRAWAAVRESSPAQALAPPIGRFVDADGLRLYVQEHGPADAPVVVLVHGTSSWSGTWRDTQAELAWRGYHVVALDLPPFGFSERPADARYARADQARRIWAAVDALGFEQVALVGHSYGGGPTLEAAMVAPDRVWGLVLVDAAIGLEKVGADPGPAATIAAVPWLRETVIACTFTNPWATRSVLLQLIHDPADASPDRIALYQAFFGVEGTTAAIGDWLPELVSPAPAASLDRDALRRLELDTLLIWGREDTATPPSQAEELHDLLPRSEIRWLEGVGHIPQIEDPNACHEALVPFLDDHRPVAPDDAPPPEPPRPRERRRRR